MKAKQSITASKHTLEFLRQAGRLGGLTAGERMSQAERSQRASLAARARWGKNTKGNK
jgi:hypothetical protein